MPEAKSPDAVAFLDLLMEFFEDGHRWTDRMARDRPGIERRGSHLPVGPHCSHSLRRRRATAHAPNPSFVGRSDSL
jgi:hypothetical protein